jgi:hypothetical protein
MKIRDTFGLISVIFLPTCRLPKYLLILLGFYMRQVRVFEQTSRGESMVLTLGDQGRPDIAEVARALIGEKDGAIVVIKQLPKMTSS